MDTTTDDIKISHRDWDAMMGRLAALEARSTTADVTATAPTATSAGAPPPAGAPAPMLGRRRALLGLAGAAAAGAVGVATVATASPVAAAAGDPVKAGYATESNLPTQLRVTGGGKVYGLGVVDNSPINVGTTTSALYGHASGNAFGTGLHVQTIGSASGALITSASAGLTARSSNNVLPALIAENTGTGVGARITSNRNHIELQATAAQAPPSRAGSTPAGALAMTTAGDLWYCAVSGTPGTWRRLSGPTTAGSFHVLPTPVRIYDSRPGTTPNVGAKTPLPANGTRALDLKANGSGVPAGATAALVTVLLVNAATGAGNFTIWRGGAAKPQANTLVWGGNAGRFTTTAVTALDANASVQVHASLRTNVVIDVVGYYR